MVILVAPATNGTASFTSALVALLRGASLSVFGVKG
jgi:hypothetical protein